MLQVLFAGNAGHTLITRSFARQLGLVDMHGNPTQAYSRTIRVQGVVAGAFEMIKTLNISYEIKGRPHGLPALLRMPNCPYALSFAAVHGVSLCLWPFNDC